MMRYMSVHTLDNCHESDTNIIDKTTRNRVTYNILYFLITGPQYICRGDTCSMMWHRWNEVTHVE